MKHQFKMLALSAGLVLVCALKTIAQNTQILKGTVTDKAVKSALIGASVQVFTADANPTYLKGASTDSDGYFRITELPLGRYTVVVRYINYTEAILPNILLKSGKETEISVEMEESVLLAEEVVISAKVKKEAPLNELATVSTRTFSVEETQRFAAAVNDPARMATSYAGVATGNDGNNNIVIRGNAPNGLLWRMEGVEIPNPNHFSSPGTAGGGISILSAQTLSNSDFSTGAFAAEYGNALSGVFDLKLRKGNSEKREHTIQAGVLGLDVATEGPIGLGSQTGSYLVNYRYSTLSLLGNLGVPLGGASTDFQDISFNVYLPTGHWGNFTVFGFGGLSKQTFPGKADSVEWKKDFTLKYPHVFLANTGAVGLTHSKTWGEKTFLRTALVTSATTNGIEQDYYLSEPLFAKRRIYENDFIQRKVMISSVLNHKFNAKNLIRTGAYFTVHNFDFNQSAWEWQEERLVEQVNDAGDAQTVQSFVQWQYRPSPRLTLNTGVHHLTFLRNNSTSIEPRVGAKYNIKSNQTLTLGYGLHSQIQPLATYFVKDAETGALVNKDLDMSKAHHLVLGYDLSLSKNRHIKTEIYYQHLYDIPVDRFKSSSFSMINVPEGIVSNTMINNGLGRNYGAELTVEQFLTRGFYFLLSSSIYKSEYRGSDGKWRNTRFNTDYVNTLTTGKEWDWSRRGKDRAFGVNLKLTQMGGFRTTPIDLEASRLAEETVYVDDQAFSQRNAAYFRADAGVSLRRNYVRMNTVLSLNVQNVTNRKNEFGAYYNPEKQDIHVFYQAPLIPILAYKLEF